jgi:L-threonylcarbamoyladenylate synthase
MGGGVTGRASAFAKKSVVQCLPNSEAALVRAAHVLSAGGLVAFPTETVYGLGADALSEAAVSRIFQAKGRPIDHPLIVHVANADAAKALADKWPAAAECLAHAFWPGPLTLVVPRSVRVPKAVTGGQDTVGLRVPSHPVAQALLRAFATGGSGAVAAPSANRFGQVSATRAHDVMEQLSAHMMDSDLVLDGGPCQDGLESTVVDCTGTTARILRPGVLGREAISAALAGAGLALSPSLAPLATLPKKVQGVSCLDDGDLSIASISETPVPRVSGSLASHYAPRTPLWVLPGVALRDRLQDYLSQHPGAQVAVWGFSDWPDPPYGVRVVPAPADPAGYGRLLYARLNDWDRVGLDLLCLELPPATPDWEAVHDRLRRAAF